ncbi:MAG: hypothetical protein OHK0046_16780 [Anaerolineae bacterium]
MAEATVNDLRGQREAAPVVRAWRRIAPSLVPIFAVITALLMTIPLMVITESGGNILGGLGAARSAYTALVEGALGVAVDPVLSVEDVSLALSVVESQDIDRRELLIFSRQAEEVALVGRENIRRYGETLGRYSETLTDEEIDSLGGRVSDIAIIGEDRLRDLGPLLVALSDAPRADINLLAENAVTEGAVTPELRELGAGLTPVVTEYDDDQLYNALLLIDQFGTTRIPRIYEQLLILDRLELSANDDDAIVFEDIFGLATSTTTGIERVRNLIAAETQFTNANIDDIDRLANELRLVSSLYGDDILTDPSVSAALREELPIALENNLIVRRPGNRIFIHEGATGSSAVIYSGANTPDDASDDRPEVAYWRVGDLVAFFFPASLEAMLTRAIPFIIAGLAVTLGFKAGLFNIGAEGQLYIGATLGAWVGFAAPFTSLPAPLHLLLVLIAGIIGGALWGMIPGLLKAFTGAHEVINTIMLNFIAIGIVDWLIKSTDPVILADRAASTPRTPFLDTDAWLPVFRDLSTWMLVAAAIITVLVSAYLRREMIRRDVRALILPVLYGVLVLVVGVFFRWINVRDNLHLGFVLMLGAVWFVDWFLDRTTLGFELRTVGANPDAARYAGMNVKWNIVLAMTLSGAIAGFAGMTEIAGVQHNMQPDFFAGLGFDAIAVALLARNNPRNMIYAGLLWGGLLTGAGLMQVRADISIDLVRIIQALIIMFIAADAIIRALWAIPKTGEKTTTTFSKGWGA